MNFGELVFWIVYICCVLSTGWGNWPTSAEPASRFRFGSSLAYVILIGILGYYVFNPQM